MPQNDVVLGRNRQKERLPGWQPIHTKYGGHCIDCGNTIAAAQRCLWHSQTKRLRCIGCATT